MARSKRHTHKYHKMKMGTVTVFACALSDCTHYMPSHMENMINGKKSICWECGDELIMDPVSMEMRLPKCANCRLGVSKEPEISPSLRDAIAQFTEVK